jgi:predicted ATPase/class 3 adenylate cyclase
MADLPTGTVTFLFTDIEGSTRLWQEHPAAMRDALARHDELLREAIEAHGGYVVKTTGDGFHAAFDTADAGVGAAVAAQRALDREAWGLPEPLRVRMGLHTGGAALRDGDYFGGSLNRAARLMAVAHGGQVVCSHATADLARDELAEDVGFVDLGEHRLRDLSRAEQVFQVSAPGLLSDFPSLTSLDAFPGNLPLQVSSFIGRDRELLRVAKALGESRVVTLTGVGGVGKTRLALQVAAEVLPQFREGAWLVELAPVRDPDGVVGAFAAVFGVSARAGQTLDESFVEFLRTKQLLLVVDNCEHLLEAVADLVELLELSCPALSILATSREGLALDGERVVPVPSLGSPADDSSLEVAAGADAVHLFEERAAAIDPDFALRPENAAAVVQICRRLDGVPLAIELAAARVTTMNPTELARGLDRRFDTLAGGRRRAVQRHQTLRAAIDWSYELCSEPERRLLARLAVFSGGCTRDAVEGVCAGEPLEAPTVFELLAALVTKSLVVAQRDGPETRYRLLETIREYAEERLAEHDETDVLRRVHAEYYCEFELVIVPELEGPGQIEAGRRLAAEQENLLAAMNHAIDTDNVDVAFRLLRHAPGPGQTGYELRLPVDAIDLPGATEHPFYPFALALAALFAAFRGDRQHAETLGDDALAAARRLDSDLRPHVELVVSNTRGSLAFQRGALHDAAVHAERSVAIARAAGSNLFVAGNLAAAAMYHAMAGESDAAIPLAEEGLALARQIGQPTVIVMNLAAFAAALADEDPQRARALLWESIELRKWLGYEQTFEITQAVLVAARIGDWPLTLELASRSVRGLHWLGDQPLFAAVLNVAARAVTPSDPETAAVLQGAARGLLARLVGASAVGRSVRAPDGPPAPPSGDASFVTQLRRQTTGLLQDTLGEARLRELRAEGAAMDFDHAVAYALDAIDTAQHQAQG